MVMCSVVWDFRVGRCPQHGPTVESFSFVSHLVERQGAEGRIIHPTDITLVFFLVARGSPVLLVSGLVGKTSPAHSAAKRLVAWNSNAFFNVLLFYCCTRISCTSEVTFLPWLLQEIGHFWISTPPNVSTGEWPSRLLTLLACSHMATNFLSFYWRTSTCLSFTLLKPDTHTHKPRASAFVTLPLKIMRLSSDESLSVLSSIAWFVVRRTLSSW